MASLPLALGSLALWFMPDGQFRAFCAGLVVAGDLGAVAFWVAQATGTASTMMGDLAEQWTASELRKLRRRGWRVLNHVMLKQRDIDHVLIGPGGVYAVETKWGPDPGRFQVQADESSKRRSRPPTTPTISGCG